MKGLNLDACMHAQFLPKQNWLDWLVSYYNFFIQSTKILFSFPLIAVKQKPLILSGTLEWSTPSVGYLRMGYLKQNIKWVARVPSNK
jgi:hypothetical protein